MATNLNKSLIVRCQDEQTQNVTITGGYQNIEERIAIAPSKEYLDGGGTLKDAHYVHRLFGSGLPSNWANSGDNEFLTLQVAPIGSVVTRLILTSGEVTGADIYLRVAGRKEGTAKTLGSITGDGTSGVVAGTYATNGGTGNGLTITVAVTAGVATGLTISSAGYGYTASDVITIPKAYHGGSTDITTTIATIEGALAADYTKLN